MDLITQRMKLMEAFPEKAGEIIQKFGLKDDAQFIRKGLVPEGMEFNDGEQSVVSVITTGSPDRDKEIVSPDGCIATDWNANPVVLWCHDYRQLPLGRGWIKSDNGKIVGKTIYANHPFAKQVYEYRKDGFPLAQSIGFIPTKTTEYTMDSAEGKAGIRRKFDEWILLEYSDVPVPANPEAVTIAVSKGLLGQEQAKDMGVEFIEVTEQNEIVPESKSVFIVHQPIELVKFDVKTAAENLRNLLKIRNDRIIREQVPGMIKDTFAVLKGKV